MGCVNTKEQTQEREIQRAFDVKSGSTRRSSNSNNNDDADSPVNPLVCPAASSEHSIRGAITDQTVTTPGSPAVPLGVSRAGSFRVDGTSAAAPADGSNHDTTAAVHGGRGGGGEASSNNNSSSAVARGGRGGTTVVIQSGRNSSNNDVATAETIITTTTCPSPRGAARPLERHLDSLDRYQTASGPGTPRSSQSSQTPLPHNAAGGGLLSTQNSLSTRGGASSNATGGMTRVPSWSNTSTSGNANNNGGGGGGAAAAATATTTTRRRIVPRTPFEAPAQYLLLVDAPCAVTEEEEKRVKRLHQSLTKSEWRLDIR